MLTILVLRETQLVIMNSWSVRDLKSLLAYKNTNNYPNRQTFLSF